MCRGLPLTIDLRDVDTNKSLDQEQRAAIEVILDCRKTMAESKPLAPTDRPTRDDLLSDLIGRCVRIESSDYKIEGQAGYVSGRQEVIIPVRSKLIVSRRM